MALGKSYLSKIVCTECSAKLEKKRNRRFCYVFSFGIALALFIVAVMITIYLLDSIF